MRQHVSNNRTHGGRLLTGDGLRTFDNQVDDNSRVCVFQFCVWHPEFLNSGCQTHRYLHHSSWIQHAIVWHSLKSDTLPLSEGGTSIPGVRLECIKRESHNQWNIWTNQPNNMLCDSEWKSIWISHFLSPNTLSSSSLSNRRVNGPGLILAWIYISALENKVVF